MFVSYKALKVTSGMRETRYQFQNDCGVQDWVIRLRIKELSSLSRQQEVSGL